MKQKVVTASESPVKNEAVKTAFSKVFPETEFNYTAVSVPSEVPDQPSDNEETFSGAKNRALNAREKINDANFWIGIEGGIEKNNSETEAFAWVYIISKAQTGKARTASFFLPKKITDLLEKGYELGMRMIWFSNKKIQKRKPER